jgi:hypothetical protein
MPILVQEIVNRALSALDAEGSDRYLFDQDFKPALNYAEEWITSAFNKGFAENKLSGEGLRELAKIGVWQANNFSRIAFNPTVMGHDLWTVLAIYPNPTVSPFRAPTPNINKSLSQYIPDLAYVSGKASTSRLTFEEWNENQDNVFMPGNNLLQGALVEYAYLDFLDYSAVGYNNPGTYELEVRPSVANKYVALGYLKRPIPVALITDSIQFPASLTNIILEKTLMYISVKQGDQTTLYGVTERDIQTLAQLLS